MRILQLDNLNFDDPIGLPSLPMGEHFDESEQPNAINSIFSSIYHDEDELTQPNNNDKDVRLGSGIGRGFMDILGGNTEDDNSTPGHVSGDSKSMDPITMAVFGTLMVLIIVALFYRNKLCPKPELEEVEEEEEDVAAKDSSDDEDESDDE